SCNRIRRGLTGHLHVTAEKESADSIVRIPSAEAENPRPEAHGERFNLDREKLSYKEVPQLMNDNDDGEHQKCNDDVGKDATDHVYPATDPPPILACCTHVSAPRCRLR